MWDRYTAATVAAILFVLSVSYCHGGPLDANGNKVKRIASSLAIPAPGRVEEAFMQLDNHVVFDKELRAKLINTVHVDQPVTGSTRASAATPIVILLVIVASVTYLICNLNRRRIRYGKQRYETRERDRKPFFDLIARERSGRERDVDGDGERVDQPHPHPRNIRQSRRPSEQGRRETDAGTDRLDHSDDTPLGTWSHYLRS